MILMSIARSPTDIEPRLTRNAIFLPFQSTVRRPPETWTIDQLRSAGGAAGADGVGQLAQRRHRVGPGEARVGDALAAHERLARRRVLPAAHQVALDHHARDRAAAAANLAGDVARHLGLARRILAA